MGGKEGIKIRKASLSVAPPIITLCLLPPVSERGLLAPRHFVPLPWVEVKGIHLYFFYPAFPILLPSSPHNNHLVR